LATNESLALFINKKSRTSFIKKLIRLKLSIGKLSVTVDYLFYLEMKKGRLRPRAKI
jgi:hypothetical protein